MRFVVAALLIGTAAHAQPKALRSTIDTFVALSIEPGVAAPRAIAADYMAMTEPRPPGGRAGAASTCSTCTRAACSRSTCRASRQR